MLKRLKETLVESFVGAICLGYLFAQGLIHLAYVFVEPVASWITRKEYRALTMRSEISNQVFFEGSIVELGRATALLLLGYILLRWLYYKPVPRVAEIMLDGAQD